MHVAALGASLLKGAAQQHPDALELRDRGPAGDRLFCCVDLVAARVLRTVENPSLLRLRARRTVSPVGGPDLLAVDVPGLGCIEAPVVVARRTSADYWGRQPELAVLAGPWAGALSTYLGQEVVLARARPRDVVYGGGVSLVTTSSLRELARRAGTSTDGSALVEDAERWRANLVVDSGDAPPFVEDGWVGRTLQVGRVRLQVRGPVPRCAVVRFRPRDGVREGWDPLGLLAADRLREREVVFGVDAEVGSPGTVTTGDTVHVS